MPSDLPKTTVKFLIALLKNQAKLWLGEDATGIAAQTFLDEDLQKRLDDWLKSSETAQKLSKTAEQAQLYLQEPRNCPDPDLRHFFRDLTFGDLPEVQAALADLPQAMDANGVRQALQAAFARDLPNVPPEQQVEAARLYTEALLQAVGTLADFTLPIIRQTVQDNSKKLDELGLGQAEIKALLKNLLDARPVQAASPTLPGDLPIGSYLPIQPNPYFTGRKAELKRLVEALLGNEGGAIINQQALVGMGGLGKTQLAVQFAWQEGYRFVGVHWISAYRQEQAALAVETVIKDSIVRCGRALYLPGWPEGEQELERQVSLTIEAWKQSGPRLIILDNLEDLSAASAWLARLRHTNLRLVVTTRQKDWPPAFGLHELPLSTFSLDESLAFLRCSLDETHASQTDLEALHQRFGGLPLPLDLAASYLQHIRGLTVTAYLAQLNLEHASLKNWRARHPTATQHDKDVAASFALSWERVESEAARQLFLLAGYGLPNEPLPQDVLQAAAELDEAAYSEAVDLLQGLSLLQPEPSLHPLLAEFARLQDGDQTALFRWARILAWRGYPFGTEHGGLYRDPALARYLRLSLADLLRAVNLAEMDSKKRSTLCFHTAFLLTHFGDLDGAMKLYQQALQIDEGLGDLQGKSTTLHQMAGIYVTRGDLDGAMKLYQQSLETFESLGNLRGKAVTQGEMAKIFVTRGNLEKGLELQDEKLETVRKLGDKREEAVAVATKAQILVTRGDLDDALKLYQQALEITESLDDLQGKATTLHNLAGIYVTRGDLEGAMKLYRQALEIAESLGNLKKKATTLHQMAGIYVTCGDLEGAMKLYQQSLEIAEGLGDQKVKSDTLGNMAIVYMMRGDLDEALKLYQKSFDIKEYLGDLQGKIRILASMASIVNDADANHALQLYSQALEISQKLQEPFAIANVLVMMSTPLLAMLQHEQALLCLIKSFNFFIELQAKQEINSTAARLKNMRERLGAPEFDALWKKQIDSPLPDWLTS